MNMNRMKELVNILNKAGALYYNGEDSFLTDGEYDALFNELRDLEKENNAVLANSPTMKVGNEVTSLLDEVTIEGKPMLSLDKVHSAAEVVAFGGSYDLMASIKCDGLSVRLIYENGKLKSANTRGDGYKGADITEHIKQFTNVPLSIEKKTRYIVDGEAVILQKDFDEINRQKIEAGEKPFANSRNLASGSLSLLDMSIVKERHLTFILWDVIEGSDLPLLNYRFDEAADLGFLTVPGFILDATRVENETVDELNDEILSMAKENGIPCDGVVWKINDLAEGEKLGGTAHHFLNAVAFKPSDVEAETELIDIELSMGRTGVLTPVAIFKPVELEGTEIERASLHNVSVMNAMLGHNPLKGQKIWVCKKNQIIPQITRAEIVEFFDDSQRIFKKQFMKCPICGEHLSVKESDSGVLNFVCDNPDCEGKLVTRLDHFLGIKGLNVKGLSKMTLSKLIDWGWLNNKLDVYMLKDHRAEWIKKPGFGVASVDKILTAIENSKKDVDLAPFISSLGIPLVGKTVAKEIVKHFGSWESFRNDGVGGDWTTIKGFGEEMDRAINQFDYSEADMLAKSFAFAETKVQEDDKFAGVTFCVTGKLKIFKKRDDLKADIESKGGKMTSTVSSKTTYLVTNTPDSGTEKNKQAQKLGIPIITEEDYLKL